jgi:hypothetical protein
MAVPQILAATVTIAFEGLMMFQGNGKGGKHVAVVDANCYYKHRPIIEIWRKVNPGDTELTRLNPPIELNAGDRVELGIGTGIVTTSARYRRRVPGLTDFIAQGHVSDDVIEGTTMSKVDGVVALVGLPPGRLTTWGAFDEKVRVVGNIKEYCFARFVILEPDPPISTSAITVHHFGVVNPESFPLQPGDLVIVSNTSTDQYPLHFPAYSRLLDQKDDGGTLLPVSLVHTACDPNDTVILEDTLQQKVLEDIERRVPHGDCGPIDNP